MSALHTRFTIAAAGLLAAGIVAAACSSSSTSATSSSASGFVVTPQLWGEMKPVVSVKELMRDMLDPIADNIFDAIAIIVDKNGTVEHGPKTEEEWATVRIGGVTMAEGAYLLKVRSRPWAPPETKTTARVPTLWSCRQPRSPQRSRRIRWNGTRESRRSGTSACR